MGGVIIKRKDSQTKTKHPDKIMHLTER
ncbi:MAG: hypothetical protein ACI884_002483 [Ulvibacter sp.]